MIYNAKLAAADMILSETPGNVKRFKTYALEQKPKNIWKNSPLTVYDVNEAIKRSKKIVGIGYIISWPNLIKQCSFVRESVNEKTCWHTPETEFEQLRRYREMETGGCLAEEIIGGDETRFWLESKTLDDYFKKWSTSLDKDIVLNERKLP